MNWEIFITTGLVSKPLIQFRWAIDKKFAFMKLDENFRSQLQLIYFDPT